MKKINEYLQYRKNRKAAMMALAGIAACILPAMEDMAVQGTGIMKFIARLADAAEDMGGERLVQMVLSEVSDALQSDNERITEILTYMASLNPGDIRKILVHSAVGTMPGSTGGSMPVPKDGDGNG